MNSKTTALKILPQPGNRPLPVQLSKVTEPFWDALEQGVLQTTQCNNCKRLTFPPKALCPGCHSSDISWQHLSGNGLLYSYTSIHAAAPVFESSLPLRVAIVDLDEGIRLVTRLLDSDTPVSLDSRIEMVVTRYQDGCLFAAEIAK